MMPIGDIVERLGIENSRSILGEGWEESQQNVPDGTLFFLDRQFINDTCAYLSLPPELAASAVDAGKRISDDAALRALAWHAHHRMFEQSKKIANWPALYEALGEDAGLFYLLVLISGLPQLLEHYDLRAIPEEVRRDTLADLLLYIHQYHKRHGRWGLDSLYGGGWLARHFRGQIYQLGRLQFGYRSFPGRFRAFRNHKSGAVTVVAESGSEFRSDGQLNGAGGVAKSSGTWISRLSENATEVVGSPIDPATGCAQKLPRHLNINEWEPVLMPGDPCLDIHIPQGPAITAERCRSSFEAAVEFFPKHYPEKPFKAFLCNSWLCDPQLASYLEPDSNIVRFQREFYLLPTDSDAWSAVRYVFGIDIPYGSIERLDTNALPRNNSLQRALIEHLEAGGHWRKAEALLLLEDFNRWGTHPYGNQAPQ